MDPADEEKEASEVLHSLLSVSRVQNPQTQQEQIIWQLDAAEVTERPPSLIHHHHIPVAYLSGDNRFAASKSTDKPLTYVLRHNVVSSGPKYPKQMETEPELLEPQKIMLIQELDSSFAEAEHVYEDDNVNVLETKLFKVDGGDEDGLYHRISEGEKPELEYVAVDVEDNNNDDAETLGRAPGVETQASKARPKRRGKRALQRKRPAKRKRETDPLTSESDAEKPTRRPPKKNLKRNRRAVKKAVHVKEKMKPKSYSNQAVKLRMSMQDVKQEDTSDNEDRTEEAPPMRPSHNELTKLEDNAEQVQDRFLVGCECYENNCFDDLSAEKVFRHRLNIADLTKAEHDMYLMGVIMASMQNPDETCRHKERIRIRSSYVYQGKKICLTAFLYLEHVTLYQMKRLRKHLRYHGVSPRIHGNYGRKPSNTLSLDIYQHATHFVQRFIEQNSVKSVPSFTTYSPTARSDAEPGKKPKKLRIPNRMTSFHLPPECKKKTVHTAYKAYCEASQPPLKVMQYSTFTSFLKKQFPNVKFQKPDKKPEERGMESRVAVQVSSDEAEKKVKKEKKGKRVQTENKTVQTCMAGNKFLPPPPPPLMMAPKSPTHGYFNKGQVVAGPLVLGQPVQLCSTSQMNGAQMNPMLVGNQIISTHCVAAQPTYTQHVYTVQSINDLDH